MIFNIKGYPLINGGNGVKIKNMGHIFEDTNTI